jgi:hypothetical protein
MGTRPFQSGAAGQYDEALNSPENIFIFYWTRTAADA